MAVDMNKLVNLDRLKEFQTSENAATASEFSTSKSYAAGAYVYYKGKLKKFKTAHEAGAWIGTDAEDAKLADDVSVLKESINTYLSVNTWQGIVRVLRNGGTVPNGTEFTVPHKVYGDVEFVTRRMNVDKVADDPNAQTVTIQTKYLLSINGGTSAATFQYDRQEAFHKALTEAIPAGSVCKFRNPTVYGSWNVGTYHFTATNEIPVGAMLCINTYQNTPLLSSQVNVFANPKATSTLAQYDIADGDGDATVDLGDWTNHPQRVSFGSNNEAEAGITQWLNGVTGDSFMDSIWEQKTPHDMMNSAFTSLKGFLGGFPEEFQNALKLCNVHNITNDVFEDPDGNYVVNDEYTHLAKLWLPSRKEIYGSNETAKEESETQFPYYAEIATTDADKLMYAKGATSPISYWLRTPHASVADYVRVCYTGSGGALDGSSAVVAYGVAPLGILA